MAKSTSFSIGIDNILVQVRPHGRATTSFPKSLSTTDTRREQSETLHQWFVRLVDKYSAGDPRRVGIEENIAAFANFRWQKETLLYASIPVLITETDLDEFYLEGKSRAVYLRLDVDFSTLGDPFSHPLAHIHVGDDALLRFALDGGDSGNVILDYFEFVYRNYVPSKWLDWAKRQWSSRRIVEEEEEKDPFDRVVQAFTDGQFQVLREQADVIAQIKKVLREAKDLDFPARVDSADRLILEYPMAR